MVIKTIVEEDFVNYKIPSMYIGTAFCGGKCCIEAGIPLSVCQNDEWREIATVDMDDEKIVERYLNNDITKSICFAGLEPFEQTEEMLCLIKKFREHTDDMIVIYTGYYKEEILPEIEALKSFPNIIIKFGRYIPNRESRYDEVLGVRLASDNQYAEQIS